MTQADSAPRQPLRPHTAVDAVADDYFDALVAASPIMMTDLGMTERQDELDDFSPAGIEARVDLARGALARLREIRPADEVDEVTVDALTERLGLDVECHEAGLTLSDVNVIASGLHTIRSCFDLMPRDTSEQWATMARRLHAVPSAVDQWFEAQREGARRGLVPAIRQVEAVVGQCRGWVADGGYYDGLVSGAATSDGPLTGQVADDLADAVAVAKAAIAGAADRLEAEVAPTARERDGIGRELYPLYSRQFLGAAIDLEETYAWGQDELARITDLMRQVARKITGGDDVDAARAALDDDPAYQLHGTPALQTWMQTQADEAIEALADVHFDIPEPVRRIEGCIAPTNDGGIYYTGPSDDFSRPGRMWWSVTPGTETFGTWRELTTVYHEGVPGHHLQVAQTTYRKDLLNRWRRLGSWTSGYGEGWALYAEWLMADLGFMADPGDFLGLLEGQSLRAARVVLDIGVHCGFAAPAELGGGPWTYDLAWEFLRRHASMEEQMARFELHRYLGWPGQAPSYKIGERVWLQLRDEVRTRRGADFDLKEFHREALDVGSVGLDTLRRAMLR